MFYDKLKQIIDNLSKLEADNSVELPVLASEIKELQELSKIPCITFTSDDVILNGNKKTLIKLSEDVVKGKLDDKMFQRLEERFDKATADKIRKNLSVTDITNMLQSTLNTMSEQPVVHPARTLKNFYGGK